jgi:hypothetical protein
MRLLVLAVASIVLLLAVWLLILSGAVEEPTPAGRVEAAIIPPLNLEAPPPPAPVTSTTPSTSMPRAHETAPIKPTPIAGEVADVIRAGFARFGPAVAEQAVRVARCESTLNPQATNGHHAGLFQVAEPYHRARITRLGFTWAQMLEPAPNTAVAADLYAESGWQPWSCRWAA